MMISKRLAAARRTAGLTQAELAKAVGVSPQKVGDWEQGRRRINLDDMGRVARALGIDPVALVGW